MIQLFIYLVFTAIILVIAKQYLDKKGHPKGLFYLFFAEMWERFSFYGMRALLVLYLIKDYYSSLQNNEEVAYGIYAAYGALVYLTPLIGGYVADKFIGYRKAILFGGTLMALGHFFMAFPSDTFFYGALGLLIMGNGFFKPNISTLVGSLYEENDLKRDSGFTIFYMGINLGAMIAPLFCGYLGEVYGWHYGFGAAGIGMLAGLLVFWRGITANVLEDKGLQPVEYINKKIAGLSITNFIYTLGFLAVPVFAYLIILDIQSKVLGSVLVFVGAAVLAYLIFIIYDYYRKNDAKSAERLISIIILAIFCTIFWACFEQAGSSITIWADKCVNLVGLNASQTNAINPAYIVLLAIPFSWMWTKLGAMNRNPNTPMKFAFGILQLGLGFLVFAITAHFVGENGKVPFLFVFLGYFLITTGELFLSPIGLAKVTQLSPKRIIAFMMGVWFLSSTFAHYISGGIAKMTTKPFYTEINLFTINDGDNQNTYMFNMAFDFNNNLTGIKQLEIDSYNNSTETVSDSLFTKHDQLVVSKLIKKKLAENKEDFSWNINDKKMLLIDVKGKQEKIKDEDQNLIDATIYDFRLGKEKKSDEESESSIVEIIANIFPWNFISEKETSDDKNLDFDNLKDMPSVLTTVYMTNESISGNSDAIAGISYISDKEAVTNWQGISDSILTSNKHLKNLDPRNYSNKISAMEGAISLTFPFSIGRGPSDGLSKMSYSLMGQPKIENKAIATLLQYNNVYAKIGIVTIFIGLFVIAISGFIKKLMHGIH